MWVLIFWTKILFDQNFFRHKIFGTQYFFGPKLFKPNFFDPKSFWPNIFWEPICLEPKFFGLIKVLTKLFWQQDIFKDDFTSTKLSSTQLGTTQLQLVLVYCGIFTASIPGSLGPIFQEQMGFLPSQYPKIKFLLTVVSLDSRFSRRRFLTVLR